MPRWRASESGFGRMALGFGGFTSAAAALARILFFVFTIVFLVTLIATIF